ncbi:MAG TPA: polysaccharide biosynthesis tyrosine autokinase, partial [Verrucomicrobiae bacterium]
MHSPASLQTRNSSAPLDFRTFYFLLRDRAWLILLCLVIAALATATYLLRTPKVYAAKSVLQVEQEEAKILNIQRIQQEDLQGQEVLKTIEQTLQNRAMLQRVIEANHLEQDPKFAAGAAGKISSKEELVVKLSKMVEVRLRKGTRLIDINVENTDPALTALVANSLVHEFLRQNYEHNSDSSQVANEFLVKEATSLRQKLDTSESALQAYKEKLQSSSLEDREKVVGEKLKELSTKATEAKSQRIMQETAYKQIQALGKDPAALMVLPAVANHPAITEIKSNIAKKESDIANLKQRYKALHPKMLQAESELAEWKNALQRAILNIPQTIQSSYESAKAAEAALDGALKEQELTAVELDKLATRYNALARDVESDRALYQSVLNRMKETSVTKDMKPEKIRIIQRAEVPERPVKPEPIKVMATGILAGLGSSILLILLLNALDMTLKTVDQTEEYLNLPVLSAVPKFTGGNNDQRRLIVQDEAQSSEAESFRTLRTALSMLGRKEDRRVFLFTSAVPSEGKTFCSLNYGLCLAQQGLRTLVMDCDLRRPAVQKTLLPDGIKRFGVTDYLTGQKTIKDIVHTTPYQNFYFIPAGTHAPNPAELLAQTGIDALLKDALDEFDRVIIDSAPIHAVSDTLLILNKVQTACLVVRARKTPRTAVKRAIQLLQEAGAPLSGVILNLLPRS